jgi:hypothetical protein
LKAKDPSTDSGIESYVRSQLDDQIMEWIPTKTSYYLKSRLKLDISDEQKNKIEKSVK